MPRFKLQALDLGALELFVLLLTAGHPDYIVLGFGVEPVLCLNPREQGLLCGLVCD